MTTFALEWLRRLARFLLQAILPSAYEHDIAGGARGFQRVHGEVRHRLGDGINRVLGIGLGAEQASLLRCPDGEDHGPIELRSARHGAGDLQLTRYACAVVVGAGANGASFSIWRANAIGVPVGAVDDGLPGPFRAGELGQDVVALNLIVGDRRRRR